MVKIKSVTKNCRKTVWKVHKFWTIRENFLSIIINLSDTLVFFNPEQYVNVFSTILEIYFDILKVS